MSFEDSSNNSLINVTVKKKPPLVLMISSIPVQHDALKILHGKCRLRTLEKSPPNRKEILKKVIGVEGIIWIGYAKLDAEILEVAGDQLKVISVASYSLYHIDVKRANELNITIGYLMHMPQGSHATFSIGLMISLARRYVRGRKKIQNSNWDLSNCNPKLYGQDIRGSTVGLIGWGDYARELLTRLNSFGVKNFLIADPNNEIGQYKMRQVTMNNLLKRSDFIFLCCALTDKTQRIINETTLNKMKSNCVLVNILQPGLIDQEALYEACLNEKIWGAGLDQFEHEPLPPNSKFLKLDNLIITPLIAWQTVKTTELIVTVVANNLLKGLGSARKTENLG